MSCIYDYDSPCECDIEACRTCYKNPDKPEPDCDPEKEEVKNVYHV